MLVNGARSAGWNLSDNIERARESGHPNVALLEGIARVISDGASLSTLDEFPEWREASVT